MCALQSYQLIHMDEAASELTRLHAEVRKMCKCGDAFHGVRRRYICQRCCQINSFDRYANVIKLLKLRDKTRSSEMLRCCAPPVLQQGPLASSPYLVLILTACISDILSWP